jgi:protein TonB
MYADQRYVPRTPRSISLGGSFAVSGLLIAGLISFVPNIIPRPLDGPIETYPVPIDEPPPPIPLEKPKTDTQPLQPLPYVPPTTIADPDRPVIESTKTLPVEPPPTTLEKPGPTVIDEPVALPPLIGAQQDARFARDYQPEYPAQELRAQRDGKVSVRVLIGADGRVRAVEQVSATSAAFFEATRRQALSRWRFKPATRGGVPQESWKTMSVRFELKNL